MSRISRGNSSRWDSGVDDMAMSSSVIGAVGRTDVVGCDGKMRYGGSGAVDVVW